MPIYEYKCPNCGVVEAFQKITDDPLTKCPNCRRKVKRQISLNNFHLKGTGWYATDYAGKNGGNGHFKKKDAAKDISETKSEPAKTETSDAKPTKETKETKETKSTGTSAS